MDSCIKPALDRMGDKRRIILLQLSPECYQRMVEEDHVTQLIRSRSPVLYITASKPAIKLQENLRDEDRGSVFFIDLATGSGSDVSRRYGNALFIASPRELTELSIAVCTSADVFGDRKRLVVLDNVATLAVANDERSVEKFVHFLTSRLRNAGDSGLIIHVTGGAGDAGLADSLSQLCDEVVKI